MNCTYPHCMRLYGGCGFGCSPIGQYVGLSKDRVVFLAKHPTRPGCFCVGFIGDDGTQTRFLLSEEALDTLVAMRADPIVGTPEKEFNP
jgi:hypothetical protein